MACGHLHAADERTKNLGLEATGILSIHVLLSKIGFKRNWSHSHAYRHGMEAGLGGVAGSCPWKLSLEDVPEWAFQLLLFAMTRGEQILVDSQLALPRVA